MYSVVHLHLNFKKFNIYFKFEGFSFKRIVRVDPKQDKEILKISTSSIELFCIKVLRVSCEIQKISTTGVVDRVLDIKLNCLINCFRFFVEQNFFLLLNFIR